MRTTDEIREDRETACWERYLLLLILVPLLIIMLLTMWPLALGGFVIRCVLAKHRHPYRYSYCANADHANIHRRIWADLNRKRFYHVSTVNSCLQPEFLARLNNLRNTQVRALELGRRVATSQLRPSPKIFVHSPSDTELQNNGTLSTPQHMALFSISEGERLAMAQSDDGTPVISYSNVKPDETSFYTASQQCKKIIPDGVSQQQHTDSNGSNSNHNGSTTNSNNNDMQMSNYTFACCSSNPADMSYGQGSVGSDQYGGQVGSSNPADMSYGQGSVGSDQYGGGGQVGSSNPADMSYGQGSVGSDQYGGGGGQVGLEQYMGGAEQGPVGLEQYDVGQGTSGQCTDGIHCGDEDEDDDNGGATAAETNDDKNGSITSVPDLVPNNKIKSSSDTDPTSSPDSPPPAKMSPVTTPDTDQVRSPSSPEDDSIETRIQIEIKQTPQATQAAVGSGSGSGTGVNHNHNQPSTSSASDPPPTDAGSQSTPQRNNPPPGRKNTVTSTTTRSSGYSNSPSTRGSRDDSIRDIPSPRDHGTCINFPSDLDFACFQEVFDKRAAQKLVAGLHGFFGHIVYDVGIDSWRSNRFLMNSGLVIASRYPIVDVAFECFKQSQNEDTAISKGLLMVKVRII